MTDLDFFFWQIVEFSNQPGHDATSDHARPWFGSRTEVPNRCSRHNQHDIIILICPSFGLIYLRYRPFIQLEASFRSSRFL